MPESVLAGPFASGRAQLSGIATDKTLTVVSGTNPLDFEPLSSSPSGNVTSDGAGVHHELWVQDDSFSVVPDAGGDDGFDGDKRTAVEYLRESLFDPGNKVHDSQCV